LLPLRPTAPLFPASLLTLVRVTCKSIFLD
jgi:hypothetical protein